LLDTPTLTGIGALVLGFLVMIAGPLIHLLGIALFVGGIAFLAWYCTRDIARWVQARRTQ
jgi:putative copper export protein